jgi:hypothetical protein
MASFAKLNNNIVERVESVVNDVLKDSNGIEQESIGIQFLKTLYNEPNSVWKQTSYNTIGGVHILGGTPFRKNHASIGYTYDENRDAFIPPKQYNSWILNEDTCLWNAPVACPQDGNIYKWNEQTLSWDLLWEKPLPYPQDGKTYTWNDQNRSWDLLPYPQDGKTYTWNDQNKSWDLLP